jgi:hypothetical protein
MNWLSLSETTDDTQSWKNMFCVSLIVNIAIVKDTNVTNF